MSDFQNFTGTRPVAAQHAVDALALQAWLERHVEGFHGPLSIEMFKGGQSNPTYKLITPQRAYVMRAKPGPVAKLLPSAHAIEREYRMMGALHGTGVPVARMYALCEDESVIGRAFYVMECVDGRVMWDQALPDLSNAERGAIYDEMNRVMAALHSVRPNDIGLADFGKPGNYFERQIGRWSKQYLASITQPIPEMDKLMEWLPQNIPAMARDASLVSIVHGDYRLDNLMFHPSEPRVLAILDWELSTLGHPLADFSYHCMAWHIPRHRWAGRASPGHPDRGRVHRPLLRAHRLRDPRAAQGRLEFLSGLQPVPPLSHPARHRQARRDRHRFQRAGCFVRCWGPTACRNGLALCATGLNLFTPS